MILLMSTLKDEAIVLRRLDFSETSQVLAFFTRDHGKVRVIAKGIKRSTRARHAAGIDLLEAGHLVLSVKSTHQQELAILAEWKQTSPFTQLRRRLDRLYGAQYGAGLTANLTEDWDPHPALFEALLRFLRTMEAADECLAAVIAYQRDLLTQIGSLPVFEACVACGQVMPTRGDICFSSHDGGLLCRDCEGSRTEKLHVGRGVLSWLAGRAGARPDALEAYRILDYHLSHLMGRPLPLGRMFLDVCRATSGQPD